MFIINELSKNVDGYFLSTFFYKAADRNGGLLHMGPVWDFNLSFGVADYREAYRTDGFQIDQNPAIWWWDRLLQDPDFIRDIREKWADVREQQFSNEHILGIIDSLTLYLNEAQQRNFTRWNILTYAVWPNYYTGSSYEEEISYLRTWIVERLEWLDMKLYDWTAAGDVFKAFPVSVYPNPFTESFRFRFSTVRSVRADLTLYDLNGTEVGRILRDATYPAGEFSVEWNAQELPASIYVLVLRVNGTIVSTQKIVKLN